MAGFGFDSGAGKANGNVGDMYVVLQVVLTEKFIGTGSGVSSLTMTEGNNRNRKYKIK